MIGRWTLMSGIIAASAVIFACSTMPNRDTVVLAPSYSKLKIEQLRTLSQSEPARALEAIAAILGEESSHRPVDGPSDEALRSLAISILSSILKTELFITLKAA